MNAIYDNPVFHQYWNMTIKPLAIECSKGAELSDKLKNVKTPEEIDAITREMKESGKKDWDSLSCINRMIQDIDNPGINGPDPLSVLYSTIMVLESKNYDKKISILTDNTEVKNYKRLNAMLNRAVEFLI